MRLIRLLKRDLAKEATDWVKDDLITTLQAEQICQRYGIDYHHQNDNSLGYHILIVLGYLFIGLAILVLIGHNWEDIPRGLRMGGIITITLGFNLLGLWQYQRDQIRAAISWLFLGGLCYGAAIMLIAQIYHIGEHYPDGVLFWTIGVLPLALLLRSTVLMFLATALAFTWFFVETDLEYYPTLFPFFLAALGWHIFKIKHNSLLFLIFVAGIVLFFFFDLAWVAGEFRRFNVIDEHIPMMGMTAVLAYGFARWLQAQKNPVYKDYGALLAVWTLRATVVLWMIFSFEDPWDEMMRHTWDDYDYVLWVSGGFSLASLLFAYMGYRSIKSILGTLAFVIVFNLALLGILFVDPDNAAKMQVFANLVLVLGGVWLIALGVHEGITHYFYLGVMTILFTALLRYIDLVGDYIGASILFAVFAGVLLGAARFWKKRLKQSEGGQS